MTRRIVTVSPDENIESAARTMTRFGISSLIIKHNDSVLGILTEKDVLSRVVASGRDPNMVLVKDVMTCQLISVEPSTSIDDASKIMLENRIKKLPVIDPTEPDTIKGILSLTDIASYKPQIIKLFQDLNQVKQVDIYDLVKQPESQHLELKASLRYNNRQHCLDPDLEFNCLKTVCAFLNAEGGDLLIGVNDQNRVVGLKYDYGTFTKNNRDAFETYLVNQISHKIGNIYLKNLKFLFPQVFGHEICRVNVEPSLEPAFLHHKGRQYFYVRTGNNSQPFKISEAARYMVEKWPDVMAPGDAIPVQ